MDTLETKSIIYSFYVIHQILVCREKSKRYSEQGAATVCLHALRVVDKTYGFTPAEGARKYQHILSASANVKRQSNENNIQEVKNERESDWKKRKLEACNVNETNEADQEENCR